MSRIAVRGSVDLRSCDEVADHLSHQQPSRETVTVDLTACDGAVWPYAERLGMIVAAFSRTVDINVRLPREPHGDPGPRVIPGADERPELAAWFPLSLAALRARFTVSVGESAERIALFNHRPMWDAGIVARRGVYVVDDLDKRAHLAAESGGGFSSRFQLWMRQANVFAGGADRFVWQAAAQISHEAIQNVYDHAAKRPYEANAPLFSIAETARVTGDFDRSRSSTAARGMLPPIESSLLGVTVVDAGVGIAARHSGSLEIYKGSFEDELRHFRDALATGRSIKMRAADATVRAAPGFGFTIVASFTRMARGVCEIASGRTRAVFDARDQTTQGYVVATEAATLLPGTQVSVRLPLGAR